MLGITYLVHVIILIIMCVNTREIKNSHYFLDSWNQFTCWNRASTVGSQNRNDLQAKKGTEIWERKENRDGNKWKLIPTSVTTSSVSIASSTKSNRCWRWQNISRELWYFVLAPVQPTIVYHPRIIVSWNNMCRNLQKKSSHFLVFISSETKYMLSNKGISRTIRSYEKESSIILENVPI